MQAEMNKLFAEGGVMQEGGTVDPVSGNDVPPGSLQEEVRDDIDAKLSEGEFVIPADVVRYIGLEKLMMMRDKAKAGLKRMEEIGQMGNAEEVEDAEALHGEENEMDDEAFSSEIDSIMNEEGEQEYAAGGDVRKYAPGGYVGGAENAELYRDAPIRGFEMVAMTNDAGQVIYIPFINGVAQLSIPMGYKVKPSTTTTTPDVAPDTGGAGGDAGAGGGAGAGDSGSGSGGSDSSSGPGFSIGPDGFATPSTTSSAIASVVGTAIGIAIGVPGLGTIGKSISDMSNAANAAAAMGFNVAVSDTTAAANNEGISTAAATAGPGGTGGAAASAAADAAATASANGHSDAAVGAASQAAADATVSGADAAAAAAAGAAAAAAADGADGGVGDSGPGGSSGEAGAAAAGAGPGGPGGDAGVGDSGVGVGDSGVGAGDSGVGAGDSGGGVGAGDSGVGAGDSGGGVGAGDSGGGVGAGDSGGGVGAGDSGGGVGAGDGGVGAGDGGGGVGAGDGGGGGGGGGGAGCFLTTAAVEHMGHNDNGQLLNTLRDFRDTYMRKNKEASKDVAWYYDNAPKITKILDDHPDAKNIYRKMYNRFIMPSYLAIKMGKDEVAYELYKKAINFARQEAGIKNEDIDPRYGKHGTTDSDVKKYKGLGAKSKK